MQMTQTRSTKMTNQQIAGYRAAHTRLVKRFDQYVNKGYMTKEEAAGHKSASKRKLNKILRENGFSI